MTQADTQLGRGQDAQQQTDAIASGKKYPLTVVLSSLSRAPLVLAQAVPTVVLAAGETQTHICQTRGHLYDVIFGMIAIGDRLGQDIIGSITTKLPKGASKP
jgi:hypothetical protein